MRQAIPTPAADTAREHRLAGDPSPGAWTPGLLLREQPPAGGDRSRPVLYVHGATFPSALSVMFRFEARSWADHLNAAGFTVFALDFAGFGGSDRYPAMAEAADGPPVGRAQDAAGQIARAVGHILDETGARQVSIVAHSWGTIAAARFAGEHPGLVDRLVLFGPIAQRSGAAGASPSGRWRLITNQAQYDRFVSDVPAGHPGVLIEADFPRWAADYLASDPGGAGREPAAVKVPAGPAADIAAAWSGGYPCDLAKVAAPTLLVRGEWDSLSTDDDIAWLASRLTGSARVEDVKLPKGTHLMHLETGRDRLYEATAAFLGGTGGAPQT